MNVKELAFGFVVVFAVTFGVASVVSYLYQLIVDGAGATDWPTSFRLAFTFAILFGIFLPLQEARNRRKKERRSQP